MNFLGLFNFDAPYLPWVLLGFSLLLHGNWPTSDLIGMIVGHVYYFLDEVWPKSLLHMGRAGGGAVDGVGGNRLAENQSNNNNNNDNNNLENDLSLGYDPPKIVRAPMFVVRFFDSLTRDVNDPNLPQGMGEGIEMRNEAHALDRGDYEPLRQHDSNSITGGQLNDNEDTEDDIDEDESDDDDEGDKDE